MPTVYTDYNNLMYDNLTMEKVIHWCLLLEEYGTNVKYMKGPDNNTFYILRRLPFINYGVT